jgi:hypothetical protein
MDYEQISYVDIQKYEREAQKLRAQAVRDGAVKFAGWVKSFFSARPKTDGATDRATA